MVVPMVDLILHLSSLASDSRILVTGKCLELCRRMLYALNVLCTSRSTYAPLTIYLSEIYQNGGLDHQKLVDQTAHTALLGTPGSVRASLAPIS